jgi:hypothetical protein
VPGRAWKSGELVVLRRFSCETLPVKQLFLGVSTTAAAVRFASMRWRGVRRLAVRSRLGRGAVSGVGMRRFGMGITGSGFSIRAVVVGGTVHGGGMSVVYYRCVVSVGVRCVIGRITAPTVVSASTAVDEAIAAPTVAIAPAGPWAHAQEDAVVEIARPIEADRRATIWRIVVIAVGANGLNTDADDYLRVGPGRKSRGREQRCSYD